VRLAGRVGFLSVDIGVFPTKSSMVEQPMHLERQRQMPRARYLSVRLGFENQKKMVYGLRPHSQIRFGQRWMTLIR
jgi:hypothetical protein